MAWRTTNFSTWTGAALMLALSASGLTAACATGEEPTAGEDGGRPSGTAGSGSAGLSQGGAVPGGAPNFAGSGPVNQAGSAQGGSSSTAGATSGGASGGGSGGSSGSDGGAVSAGASGSAGAGGTSGGGAGGTSGAGGSGGGSGCDWDSAACMAKSCQSGCPTNDGMSCFMRCTALITCIQAAPAACATAADPMCVKPIGTSSTPNACTMQWYQAEGGATTAGPPAQAAIDYFECACGTTVAMSETQR